MRTETLKYSIIVTVYNSERFLVQCLESVKQQGYKNWELILVNDGPTDESGIIAKTFADEINRNDSESRVIYLEHDNKGAVYSRERGICAATGDYLLFLDSDDWWDDDLIEKVNDIIIETKADIVQYGYKFKDENGENTTDAGISQKAGTGIGTYIFEKYNNSFAYKALEICYCLWSRAFKRSLFDVKEGYYAEYYDVNMTNDLLALARPLSLAKAYCFTDLYLYNYRIVSSSLCHDASIDKICSYFKSIGWAEKCLRNINGLTDEHKYFFSMRICNIIFDEYRERIYKFGCKDIKKVYVASEQVTDINNYIDIIYKKTTDWYKKAYLWSFMRKRILLPKLLYIYSDLKQRLIIKK